MEESDLVVRAARIICSASEDLSLQVALYCAGASFDESCKVSLVEKVNEKLPTVRNEIERKHMDGDNIRIRAKVCLLLSPCFYPFM